MLINIAGFHAGLYDGDRLTLGMHAIVGRTYHRTLISCDAAARGEGVVARDEVERAANAGTARTVSLDQRVPVHILYWTTWADETDTLQIRPDLYGRDRVVLDALHGDPQ